MTLTLESAGTSRAEQVQSFLTRWGRQDDTILVTPFAGTAAAPEEPPQLRTVTSATGLLHPGLPLADASTEEILPCPALELEVAALFVAAEEQSFEDGMESEFSKALVALIRTHGDLAIKLLSGFIESKGFSAEVASEALRWIGHLNDPNTFAYRLWLLGNSLKSGSLRVRDAAVLGLSFMDTTKAIPPLEKAAAAERSADLKADMGELLVYLKARQGSGKAS